MNQQAQTIKFLVAALVSVGLAVATWLGTRPTPVEGFGKVGQPFFADLKVTEATTLRVADYKEDIGEADFFVVQKVGDRWELPEFNDYPADGEDQLEKTATSLVGILRGAVASKQVADHKRLGVIDPEEPSGGAEGRGQKITLSSGDSDDDRIEIASLIIGKEVEDRTDEYYVRIPDEKETYIAKLDIELSTKFSDWVEDDLLKLDRDKVVRLESHSSNVTPDGVMDTVESLLTRTKSSEDWVLADLNAETEEINEDSIRDMVNAADNVKLAGVRQRPTLTGGEQILDGDLNIVLPKAAQGAPAEVLEQIKGQIARQFQSDLEPRGFYLYGNLDDLRLYTKAGELVVGTNDGVRYHLVFGEEFEGTEEEILVGGTKAPSEDDEPEEKPAGPEEEGADDEDESGDEDDSELKKSRYLFVRATFDETLLGEPLVEPVKPAVPEGVQVDEDGNVIEPEEEPATEEAEAAESEEAEATESEDGEGEADEPEEGAEEGEGEAEAESAEEEKPDPVADYKAALATYNSDKATYDSDVAARKTKIEDGKKLAEELNSRFGDWYYVISADDFEKLRQTRDKLVKEKEQEAPEGGDTPAAPSLNPLDGLPSTPAPTTPDSDTPDSPTTPEKPESETPATPDSETPDTPATPDSDKPETPDTPASEDSPEAESPTNDDDDKPAETDSPAEPETDSE